jgi:hypothetical protein
MEESKEEHEEEDDDEVEEEEEVLETLEPEPAGMFLHSKREAPPLLLTLSFVCTM